MVRVDFQLLAYAIIYSQTICLHVHMHQYYVFIHVYVCMRARMFVFVLFDRSILGVLLSGSTCYMEALKQY